MQQKFTNSTSSSQQSIFERCTVKKKINLLDLLEQEVKK